MAVAVVVVLCLTLISIYTPQIYKIIKINHKEYDPYSEKAVKYRVRVDFNSRVLYIKQSNSTPIVQSSSIPLLIRDPMLIGLPNNHMC